jgi:hypothetical protein
MARNPKYNQERYRRLLAQGLCSRCGKTKLVKGKTMCKDCLARHAKWRSLSEAVPRHPGMPVMCWAKGCGKDAIPGGEYCGYHDELAEEGQVTRRKASGRPRSTPEQKEAARERQRARDRAYRARKRAIENAA